jgi:hypothetical protein
MDPDERVLGELPPPRPGTLTEEEFRRRLAGKPDALRVLERDWEQGRRSRLGLPGQMIAHYTRAERAFGDILPSGCLRISSFDRMNDPQENKDWVRLVSFTGPARTAPSLEAMTRALAENDRPDLAEARVKFNLGRQRQTKILCLTAESAERSPQEDFNRAYARPRMWEQYAERHAGACLVFDRAALHDAVAPQLEALGSWWHGEVSYDNAAVQGGVDGFDVRLRELLAASNDDLEEASRRHLQSHHRALFFTKMADYRDEYEVRYVVFDGKADEYASVSYGDALRAVVLGENFPIERVDGCIEACSEAGVAIRRMQWTPWGPLAAPLSTSS